MSKIIDLTDKKFNMLTVKYKVQSKGGKAVWHCICDCGNECDVIGQYLRNGHTKSCGCLQKQRTGEVAAKKNRIDLTNKKFGLLTAIEPTDKRSGSCVVWKCKCDCGNISYVASSDLTHLKVISCGCIKQSYGEKIISNILQENKIPYKKEYSFSDLKSNKGGILRYDFAIFKNGNLIRLIEFDGKQHYEKNEHPFWELNFQEIKENDILKNNYTKEHNIPLVRIPYWERDKITLDMIMGDKYLV